MSKYVVEWQMGGEAVFESDYDEGIVDNLVSCVLTDGVAWDISDDINNDCSENPISNDGMVEYTVRKLN